MDDGGGNGTAEDARGPSFKNKPVRSSSAADVLFCVAQRLGEERSRISGTVIDGRG